MTASPASPLYRLLGYATPWRRRIQLASLCSILNKVFDLAPPLLIGAAVDIVVQREQSWFASIGVVSLDAQLLLLTILTILIWGLESAFEYAYKVMWRNLSQELQHATRMDAWKHLQELEMAYFERNHTGQIMAVLNDDVNQLERFLDGGANELIQVTTTVIVIGAIFFAASPLIAVLAMLPMPLVVYGAFRFQHRLAPLYADVRERVSQLSGRLANSLGGIATVKSYVAESFEVRQLETESNAYKTANAAAIRTSSAFVPVIRMVILMGFTATLFLGGKLTLDGHLDVGIYSVLVFLTQRLLWPLTGLAETVDLYQRAMASTKRIMDLLDTPIGIQSGGQPLNIHHGGGTIEFQKVRFEYLDGQRVLHDLDFTIAAGQTIGVVGATGSGKSTLVKLMLRFYDPSAGTIRVEGRDLREVQLKELRHAVGLVSQDVFLFGGTVRDNIAYGTFDATDEAIEAAARMAEAHEFISELAQGYDTMVGERGQRLSGGQRQRLSIARAILKNPPILILDEATSAVDNETEAAIQRSLERVAHDRTTVVIAHRLSTVRNADRILVLERGRLVEQGTHQALLDRDGVYAGLWKVQTGDRHAAGIQTSCMDRGD
ncbi:ABC transporter ATP-binding protein [Sulfidibacter corallicola]|uniref:ABC transporter ATP-binding protein n=1 Tax=Sulfidibacter corallicola TaxID=2818388 RepID=A0A8A4TNB8_SULCO|nr:ABC transporter ATP-binding protein [Sulfidibacter corallicola]QTD50428.1 ABC transporter ATP-binding protein [Sulfidibacter corallicola]